jgi:iron complex outermembrane receptor protein
MSGGLLDEIKDYQATVNNGQLDVIRGYLANAGKVRRAASSSISSFRPSERFNSTSTAPIPTRICQVQERAVPARAFRRHRCAGRHAGGAPGVPGAQPGGVRHFGPGLPGISKWAFSWGGVQCSGRLIGRRRSLSRL